MENMIIQEVEDDLLCSPDKFKSKRLYNRYHAMSFQISDINSYYDLDGLKEEPTNNNDNNNNESSKAPAIDDEDEEIVMRGKSQTISKCQDVEIRSHVQSINMKRRAFFPQSRMSISIPSAKIIESAASKDDMSFLSKYSLGKKLGEGVNAVVKLCYEKEQGEAEGNIAKPFAVKIFKTQTVVETLEIQRESQILQQLNHPSIIKFKDLVIEKSSSKAYLVQEFARGKPLSSYLNEDCQNKIMNEQQAILVIKKLLQGLAYLHSKNFTHFDIKPENIVFNELDGAIKIIDFSSSRKVFPHQKLLTSMGTLNYKSPEYFGGSKRTTKTDIWSSGVILYQLLTGFLPFDDQSNNSKRIIENIKNKSIQQDYKAMISPKMQEILECMLVINPAQRSTANQILSKLPQKIELFSLKSAIPRKQRVNQGRNKMNNFRCSIMNFDQNLSTMNTQQTFNDLIITPDLLISKTDRHLQIGSMQIDEFKNMYSSQVDHIVV